MVQQKNRGWLVWIVFALYMLALVYGLRRPAAPPEFITNTVSDKLMHAAGFTLLALLARAACRRMPGWLLWIGLGLLAAASELLQSWLNPETRSFSWGDIYANWAGIALAALLVLAWNYRKGRSKRGQHAG